MNEGIWETSLARFRDGVAAATPTPGGGAVAAVTATLAAALLRMVCGFAEKRSPDSLLDLASRRIEACEETLARCVEDDVRVFDAYMAAKKSAGEDLRGRLLACAAVPLEAAEVVREIELIVEKIAAAVPAYLASDLATATLLLGASRKALIENVETNLRVLTEGDDKFALEERRDRLIAR